MRPSFITFLVDAWRLWRTDWRVLTAVAGPFVFLPLLAFALFVQPQFALATNGIDPQDNQRFLTLWMAVWRANVPWILGVQLIGNFGMLTINLLYLDRDRPDVRAALVRALPLLPWYMLALIVAQLLALPGILLLLIGFFYLYARLALVGPALVAERQSNPVALVARSFALTRGYGLALTGAVLAVMLLTYVAEMPFGVMLDALVDAPNVYAMALVQTLDAAVTAAGTLALGLLQVAAYRRLRR